MRGYYVSAARRVRSARPAIELRVRRFLERPEVVPRGAGQRPQSCEVLALWARERLRVARDPALEAA